MLDLFERGKILLSDVRILVIDEADRMLDMGFIPDVERIVGLLPKNRQTLFFSATMPPEIRRLADAFLNDPVKSRWRRRPRRPTTVEQALVVVEPSDKREALRRLIASEDVKNALIFCNRKRDVDILFRSLTRHGFDAAALHGDMSQPKRTETLERFKNGEIRLLVASDVAARGLDIQGLSHVFNFDVPNHAEDYVHRIGRTGRAGRQGRALTLATPEDGKQVAAIEKLIGKPIPVGAVPDMAPAELDAAEDRPRRRRREDAIRSSTRDAGGSPPAPGTRCRAGTAHRDRPGRRPVAKRDNVAVFQRPASRPAAPRRHDPAPADEPRVVGFGDHLPAFLRPSAKDRRPRLRPVLPGAGHAMSGSRAIRKGQSGGRDEDHFCHGQMRTRQGI